MALHAFYISIMAAIDAVILTVGMAELLFPKQFEQRFFTPFHIWTDRWLAAHVFGKDWRPLPGWRAAIPSDVIIKTREDYYDYISSERPWQLRWTKPLHRFVGAFLIFCGLFLLGVLISNPP